MHVKSSAARLATGLVAGSLLWAGGGCASSESEVQKAAKDWCLAIRGSQVIPVYPLTEDIQPGDIFLVQVPIPRQQQLYAGDGFLALDNHLARLNPAGYQQFYDHSFFPPGQTNELPRDWIRPPATGGAWQLAPHVAFPTYGFTVRRGAGIKLAVPVNAVPVGLSMLGSSAASGTIGIKDACTLGVDTVSLYRQLKAWAQTNTDFLGYFGQKQGQTNFLRVVTRVYATGRMTVSLHDASGRGGGADVGAPNAVELSLPSLPDGTNAGQVALQNYTNSWNLLSQLVQTAGAARDAAGNLLPGGSLRLSAIGARSISIDESFTPPVIFGYIGFDCAIAADGTLGTPIPTCAALEPRYNVRRFQEFQKQFDAGTHYVQVVESNYQACSDSNRMAVRNLAAMLGLTPARMEDAEFLKALIRSFEGTPEIMTKFKVLAEYSARLH